MKISSGLNVDTIFFLDVHDHCVQGSGEKAVRGEDNLGCHSSGVFHHLHDSLSRTWDLPSRLGWLTAEPQDAAPLFLSTKR